MASPGKDNYRMKSYKNKALNPQEMRRRREEEGIQLRKQAGVRAFMDRVRGRLHAETAQSSLTGIFNWSSVV